MSKQTEALKLALHVMRNQGDIGVDEWLAAEKTILEALEKEALHKLAAESLNEGLRLDDWDKIGCVNHDCDKCKAQQKPLMDEQKDAARWRYMRQKHANWPAIVDRASDIDFDGGLDEAVDEAIAAHSITKGNT